MPTIPPTKPNNPYVLNTDVLFLVAGNSHFFPLCRVVFLVVDMGGTIIWGSGSS